ncbi:hypothetical protein FRB95_005807 [Tulasnella sp. JGI-2019a]|nr:hypothetical protein FRB93_007269 [Tulasnella sp. JGI-2019a]KAG9029031.1 hypothetical protein FRB95_005807 [Tulasnella sp. JGI-2019a]
MYAHAQRQHILQSIDHLLKVLIVYSYLVDPYIIRLLIRYIAQLQLTKPQDIDNSTSLRTFLACLCFVHVGPVLRHVFIRTEPPAVTEMVLLDFVGRLKPSSPFLITTLDVAIFLGQIVMLVIAYETGHYHPDLPDPLSPSNAESRSQDGDEESLLGAYEKPLPPDPGAGPVLHLRLRSAWNRLVRPPEPRSDLSGGSTATTSAASTVRRYPTFTSILIQSLFQTLDRNRDRPLQPSGTSSAPAPPPVSTEPRTIPGALGGDW